jgi:hypothetical protein
MKHRNYFAVYDHLFSKYRNQEIVFVEVGVLDGGSLFLWRDYLGPKARIIGIDLNPAARKWVDFGFEIYIGDQADPAFWQDFFKKAGPIDVLLDDGGHTNEQQVTSVVESLHHINDGGLIVVEDVHTSYQKEFGNPSRGSFIEFSKLGIDSMHSRFPELGIPKSAFAQAVWAINFYESIVAFQINRNLCLMNHPVANNGVLLESSSNSDFRYNTDPQIMRFLKTLYKISSLDYDSIGGTRKQLKRFNFILTNSLLRSLAKLILYPVRFLTHTVVRLNVRFKVFMNRKLFHSYFSKSKSS